MDLYLDLSNLDFLKNSSKDKFDTEFYNEFANKKQILYHPILDKNNHIIDKLILEREFSLSTSSPGSISNFVGSMFYGLIQENLYLAIYFGSLNQLNEVVNQIKIILIHLTQHFNNSLSLIVRLLYLTVITEEEMNFSQIMDTYKSSLSNSTFEEIYKLYQIAELKPFGFLQDKWRLLVFSEIGYYFSDTDYEKIKKDIYSIIERRLNEDNKNKRLINIISESLRNNLNRLNHEKIILVTIELLSVKDFRALWEVFRS